MQGENDSPAVPPASTSESTAAVAQTGSAPLGASTVPSVLEAKLFEVGPGVERAAHGTWYVRQPGRPLYRPLRIFTLDPAEALHNGSIALINVPYEDLEAGPIGAVFAVEGDSSLDLDSKDVLLENGLAPSVSNKAFHNQMLYAVASNVYACFRTALGRYVSWGFDVPPKTRPRLRLVAHVEGLRNAFYDRSQKAVKFGVFRSGEQVKGRNLANAPIYTCLSHDIITHELTHAILDGLRAEFLRPTGRDVLAFHEGFSDLIAVFQHFSYERVVRAEMQKVGANLKQAALLTEIARQFGNTTKGSALRTALAARPEGAEPLRYGDVTEPHELGSVLVAAVFSAFVTVFERKTEKLMRVADRMIGDRLSTDLLDLLSAQSSRLAGHFNSICIRALDYCPPVDMHLGEYLRALITADYVLVPDDKWDYRGALIDAFRERDIYPREVDSLSVDSLLWRGPRIDVPRIPRLSFERLRFRGDPSNPADAKELWRQAMALGRVVTDPQFASEFGLTAAADGVKSPVVQSIRSARRVGPDGQILFDLVAEVMQRRLVKLPNGMMHQFFGGSTIVLDPEGRIRYSISKNIGREDMVNEQAAFVSGEGRALWEDSADGLVPRSNLLQLVHDAR